MYKTINILGYKSILLWDNPLFSDHISFIRLPILIYYLSRYTSLVIENNVV